MGYLAPFPQQLERVEFVRFYFHLEFIDDFDLPRSALLQLRRELIQALETLESGEKSPTLSELKACLLPELPRDPVLLRRVQRPSPALVLTPDMSRFGLIEKGRQLILPLLLFGPAIHQLEGWVFLLRQLGEQGIYNGCGRFFVDALEGEDGSGVRSMLFCRGEPVSPLTPPIGNLFWWLERQPLVVERCRLEVVSPLRLMRRGKPLFKADFGDLFPFILRRVSAFLALYGDVDLSSEATSLLDSSLLVSTLRNKLSWQDWRSLDRVHGSQALGGLMGHLELQGETLSEISWLLQLGSLLNVGKGAAFGAGQYCLAE